MQDINGFTRIKDYEGVFAGLSKRYLSLHPGSVNLNASYQFQTDRYPMEGRATPGFVSDCKGIGRALMQGTVRLVKKLQSLVTGVCYGHHNFQVVHLMSSLWALMRWWQRMR